MMRALVAVAMALAAPTIAGQTFLVDLNNGPGTDFTSLAAAVAAVPDGAVLRVRSGGYFEFVGIDDKSLTIVGEPGAVVYAPSTSVGIQIEHLSPTKVVVLRGLGLSSAAVAQSAILRCDDNQGLVFIDGMNGIGSRVLVASQCAALLCRQCGFAGQTQVGCTLTGCEAVFDQCALVDTRVVGGSAQFSYCAMNGHPGMLVPGGAALTLSSAAVRLANGYLIGGSASGSTTGPAITGNGSARIDPSTAILAGGIGTGIALTTAAMPYVAASLLAGTTDVLTTLRGPAGEPAVLFVATRALPYQVPGLDPLWLEPTTAVVQALGVLPSGGSLQSVTALPTSPWLVGLALVWQGMTFGGNGALQVSSPSWYVLP